MGALSHWRRTVEGLSSKHVLAYHEAAGLPLHSVEASHFLGSGVRVWHILRLHMFTFTVEGLLRRRERRFKSTSMGPCRLLAFFSWNSH